MTAQEGVNAVPEALSKIQNPHKINLVSGFVMYSANMDDIHTNLPKRCDCYYKYR